MACGGVHSLELLTPQPRAVVLAERCLVKQAKNPGRGGKFEKIMRRIADAAATRAGSLVYKRGVKFLADPEWRGAYELELRADRRRGKPENTALDRRFVLVQFAESVRGLKGSTAECGGWLGVGSALICRALEGSCSGDDAHFVFDSFEGLPEPSLNDRVKSGQWWTRGDLKTDTTSIDRLLRPFPNAHVLVGWIPDRFPEVGERSFRLVHIDVDLYDPTRDSIDFFFPRLVPGGVLLLDDHGFVSCPGARKAAVEYFEDAGLPIIELPTGQAFVIKPPA